MVRCGQMRRVSEEKQILFYSLIVETGGMAHCLKAYGKDTRMVRKQKSGARKRFGSLSLLRFP